MRLLPRSARGTWLLAAAVWAVGCALAWNQLPYVPRFEWNVPKRSWITGVLPGERVVLTTPDEADSERSIRVFDPQTTRSRWLDGPRSDTGWVVLSPDGEWLALEYEQNGPRLLLIEIATGRTHEIRGFITPDGFAMWELTPFVFSPNGKLFAFSGREGDARCVRIWQTEPLRPIAVVPHAIRPHVFSRDGSSLACGLEYDSDSQRNPENLQDYVIWDVNRDRAHTRFREPAGYTIETVTEDLSNVVARFNGRVNNNTWYNRRSWDTRTGQQLWAFDDLPRLELINAGTAFVELTERNGNDPGELNVRSVRNADVIRAVPLANAEFIQAVSADGRTVATERFDFSDNGVIRDWLEKHNMDCFVAPRPRHQLRVINAGSSKATRLTAADRISDVQFSRDSSFLAVCLDSKLLQIWDIPPRKPLGWFALAGTILALPFAGLAWRRSRRLRREVA